MTALAWVGVAVAVWLAAGCVVAGLWAWAGTRLHRRDADR